MTITTTKPAATKVEKLEQAIAELWARHGWMLDDLKSHEARKGTPWFADRMRELAGIRASIRTREERLAELI